MKRALILLSITVIGLAAPARAWCEAACTQAVAAHASAEAPKAHCPSHSQKPGTSVSSSDQDQCRAIDAARTQSPARLSSIASSPAHARLASPGELRRSPATAIFGRGSRDLPTSARTYLVPLRI